MGEFTLIARAILPSAPIAKKKRKPSPRKKRKLPLRKSPKRKDKTTRNRTTNLSRPHQGREAPPKKVTELVASQTAAEVHCEPLARDYNVPQCPDPRCGFRISCVARGATARPKSLCFGARQNFHPGGSTHRKRHINYSRRQDCSRWRASG